MRTHIFPALLLILTLTLTGCQRPVAEQPSAPPEEQTEQAQPAPEEAAAASPFTSFTEEEIRAYYAAHGLELEYFRFSEQHDFALVAFKVEPRIYYDFEAIYPDGQRALVVQHHWLPVQVKIYGPDTIIMAVDNFFDDSGVYNDDEFPIMMVFSYYADFSNEKQPYYAPFHESYHVGKPDRARLTAVRFTSAGLDLEFGPPEDEEGRAIFYAAYASAPRTGFEFDAATHSGIITMQNTLIGTDFRQLINDDQERGAVLSLSLTEQDGDTIMRLELNKDAASYNVGYGALLNHEPYLSLRFSEDYCF